MNASKSVQINIMRIEIIISVRSVMQLALLAVELVLHSAFHVFMVASSKFR